MSIVKKIDILGTQKRALQNLLTRFPNYTDDDFCEIEKGAILSWRVVLVNSPEGTC